MAPDSITSTSPTTSIAYTNGRVYTMDPSHPNAEAFIVSSTGTFTAIGTTAAITAQAHAAHIPIYNLRNTFVMPGLHDAHCHLLMPALSLTSYAQLPDLGVTTANVVEKLKDGACLCKYAHMHEDWVMATGYEIPNFHRSALDAEWPDTPVMIRGGAGHSVFMNSEAMRRAGYDLQNEPDGQGTRYLRDEEGKLTGEMAEMSLSKALIGGLPRPGAAHVKRALKMAQAKLHAAGVTSVQEAATSSLMLDAFGALEAERSLKLELFPHIVYAPDWIAEESTETLHNLIDEAEKYRSEHIDSRFVKIILDGVPLEPYMTHAALNEDGTVQEQNLSILNVREAVLKYDERGMTMKIHCTGHGSTRLTLDAFEAARKRNPNGPKHEVAHCSGVHDDDYKRYKQLNVTAEMSPAFFFKHPVTEASGGLMDWNFKKLLAADAQLTIGSDWGAGALPDILPWMDGILEDVGAGDRVAGAEKVCRMLTLGGAEAVGREKELGSIEVGKKANFIAVDKDLSRGEFKDASVLTTWFEGEIVYEKADDVKST